MVHFALKKDFFKGKNYFLSRLKCDTLITMSKMSADTK